MSGVDSLIPAIRSFLCDDLGSLPLPPTVDNKRRILLERIDVVTLGPTPAPPENTPPIPPIQRRPLSSVVRLFSSSRKRYSLPASIRYPPQLPEVLEPPLPPKEPQHALSLQTSKTTEDYEVPRSVVDCVSGTGSPSHLSSQPLLRQHMRSRHSMSPQLEIVQANQSTAFVSPQTPQLHPPIVTPDSRDDIALTLPKKCLTTQTRRFSAFMDSPWTLIGALHHRYKPNKWIRLNMCLLASGSRLIAYKSGNAMNPSLVLFLCGATGVYAGRDSGMDFVIKIAHPTRGTTVLAADTETQALMWIKQINMYAQGITPSEVHSFLEHPGITNSTAVPLLPSSCIPATPIRSPSQPDGDHLTGCLPNGLEVQEDSGFSAPVSSGSEGNSADGVVSGQAFQCHPSVFKSQSSSNMCLSSAVTCIPGTVITDNLSVGSHELCNACKGIQTPVESTYPLVSTTLVQADTVSCHSVTSSVTLRPRRESLLSSMKRKVESLNSKRRARKSLSQAFGTMESRPCASKPMGLTELNQPVANVESTGPLADDNKSFTTAVQMPPPAAAARLPGSSGTCASGFDWSQLESACGLFLKSSLLFPSPNSGRMRPRSFIGPSGGSWDQSTIPFNATHIHGPLVDLTHVGFCPHHRGISRSACESHVIVSGEAYISIPGRVPWTNRWCCLRSHCLDIYPLTKQPSRARLFNSSATDDQSVTQANAWPFFSLTLEPGQVELGLAGDKYHKAALRLAVPKQSALALLFDAPDKLQMGAWIRGFIEALGIIPLDPSKLSSSYDKPAQKNHTHSSSSDSPQTTYDSPGDIYSQPCENLPIVLDNHLIYNMKRNNTGRGEVPIDQSISQIDVSSMTVYDEVCPPQDTGSVLDSKGVGYKCRRNPSSYSANPLGPPCFHPRNLRTLQQSCRDLISPDMSLESYAADQTDRWCVPPPSRRLLAQPLPPLPSVGPSGSESVTGTITSSHASSSLTPDDCAFSPVVNSEPELLHSSTGSAKTRSRNHRPPRDPQNLPGSTRRRHSSLGSMDHYEPTCSQSVGMYPDEVTPFLPDDRQIFDDGDVFLQDLESSTSRTGCTLLSGQLRSQGTSTTHVDFPSNLSLLYQDDPTGLAWTDNASPVWPEDSRFNKSVCAAAARRSVSCVTGTKPTINDPRTVATLPPRSELPSLVCLDSSCPNTLDDMRPNLLVSLTNDHSLSSTSSQTATSSGVALTAGSFSSGSGRTTRPSSMAITWPPPPTLTEEPDFHGSDSDDDHNREKPQSRTSPTSPRDADGQDTHTDVVGTEDSTATSRRRSLFLPNSTKPTVKRMHTFNGVDQSTQCPLSSSPLTDLHYSPTNASLLLVTTQLEEVQQGAKKLRSRHAALSFRLANRLVREQVHTAKKLNESGTASEDRSHSTTPPSDETRENRPKLPAASSYDHSADEGDEATSSLCARLAAIEMLIQQAESIETRLRDEVNQYWTTDLSVPAELVSNTPSEQCQTTLNPHTQRQRGRCHRARPANEIQSCPNTNPCVPGTAQHNARGRGRGGRNRRRRYYGGGGPVRNRPKAWNKSDSNGGHTVTVSPAS